VLAQEVEQDRGPALITVEYLIRPEDRAPFLAALSKLGDERRRDGAFDWWLFEDVAKPGRFVETFMLGSWIEHMRLYARVSNADRELQERLISSLRRQWKVSESAGGGSQSVMMPTSLLSGR
jgi:Transmembrane secretion effector